MKFRPPKHRVDAPCVFIHSADEAWDVDAVEKSSETHGEDCPYSRYFAGATRYDLDEVTRAGMLAAGSPVEFHLRRLSAVQMNEVQGLYERELSQGYPMTRGAFMLAARYGLMAVKRSGIDVFKLQIPGELTSADIEQLGSTDLGIELMRAIGTAVYLASKPLREDEKKP